MKKILVISFSPLHRDPRVYRQIKILHDQYEITAAGFTKPLLEKVKWWAIPQSIPRTRFYLLFQVARLKLCNFEKFYYRLNNVCCLKAIWEQSGRPSFDLVIANDVSALPISLEIADGVPVFLDAHEYSPEEYSNFRWRFLYSGYYKWLCKTYLQRVAAMSTVCASISKRYEDVFGTPSFVTYSTPFYHDLHPKQPQPESIKLVHHGGAAPERGLEEIIFMMKELDNRFTLDFYLMTSPDEEDPYVRYLQKLAAPYGSRIRFNKPVAMEELPKTLNMYDIGICLIQPLNYNYQMCLPNKFFEFIQGRLAIATGPTPEMAKLTKQWGMGIISEGFKGMNLARLLNSLTHDDIWKMKQSADRAADNLCFEESSKELLKTINQLIQT